MQREDGGRREGSRVEGSCTSGRESTWALASSWVRASTRVSSRCTRASWRKSALRQASVAQVGKRSKHAAKSCTHESSLRVTRVACARACTAAL